MNKDTHVLNRFEVERADVLFLEDQYGRICRAVLYEEYHGKWEFIAWATDRKMNYLNSYFREHDPDEYNKTWRCWNGKPTLKQAREVPWDA